MHSYDPDGLEQTYDLFTTGSHRLAIGMPLQG